MGNEENGVGRDHFVVKRRQRRGEVDLLVTDQEPSIDEFLVEPGTEKMIVIRLVDLVDLPKETLAGAEHKTAGVAKRRRESLGLGLERRRVFVQVRHVAARFSMTSIVLAKRLPS